jgi:hypothetical protein
MSLSLEESCKKYVTYCRRTGECPTFQDFNAEHYTNLPDSPETHAHFQKQLLAAYKATGLPVTRRLPSLLKRFSSDLPVAKPVPSVQVRPAMTFPNLLVESDLKLSIRTPAKPMEPMVKKQTLEEYMVRVNQSKSVLLKENKGLMVHLVSEEYQDELEKYACKLTKKTWDVLRGKGNILKMRDGSTIDRAKIILNESDLAVFINDRKQKKNGPYFIRFEGQE